MKIALFFTYGYSLKTWLDSGTLQKELSYYVELNKKFGYKFKIFTYNKFNILSFYDVDHGPRDGTPVKDWVIKNLKKNQINTEDIKIKLARPIFVCLNKFILIRLF